MKQRKNFLCNEILSIINNESFYYDYDCICINCIGCRGNASYWTKSKEQTYKDIIHSDDCWVKKLDKIGKELKKILDEEEFEKC